MRKEIVIVGGGPAGLRAAEVIAAGGHAVTVFEKKASVGRKFLVAGGGGLNLTHSEPLASFAARYGEAARWTELLHGFSPDALRAWAAELGVETFVGTSGRVFPAEKKAAPLLRRWVARLRNARVQFMPHHAWRGWERAGGRLRLFFESRGRAVVREADAAVLALGGASWPETGSEGDWGPLLQKAGVAVAPWQPANCGWRVAWPPELLARAEGKPLKNIVMKAGERSAAGDCVVTREGLEGGPLYALGPLLRAAPEVVIDFKPDLTVEALLKKAGTPPREAAALLPTVAGKWRLGAAAVALVESGGVCPDLRALAERVKAFPLRLEGPGPIAKAISSAGGVAWEALDERLMVRAVPGLFVAGEMIDWEAPTGGYLLQGCFATGTRAGLGVLAYVNKPESA